MSLNGTLKDFGIADILQLIAQQQKTGVLHLHSKEQKVQVFFKDGSIAKAESATRNKKDLIGAMLIRAELLTAQKLESALETQKRSLQRLGDVLVASGDITVDRFKQMVSLQTSETLYGLFTWKSGSYEFEQKEVEVDHDVQSPLRAESVLMEGFRRVDEWPLIKKRITSYEVSFEKLKAPPSGGSSSGSLDADLDAALGGQAPSSKHEGANPNERVVFALVSPGRDVRKLIDLSCLGEFETCKALSELVQQGYLKPLVPTGKVETLGTKASSLVRVAGVLGRVAVSALVLVGLGLLVTQASLGSLSLVGLPPSAASDPALQRFLSRQQVARIGAALATYRLEHGEVPEKLDALVAAQLLTPDDLRYPWREPYYYRPTKPGGFVLLPPLR